MTSAGRWFKVNTTWSQSEWLAVLSPASRLAWIELLGYVKAHGFDGRVRAQTPLMFGRLFAIDAADVSALLEAAQKDNALQITDGEWIVTGWDEYQGDRTSKDRMQRYRDKRKETGATEETPVTRNHSSVTRSREEKRELPTTASSEANADFEEAWRAYPRREGGNPRGKALKAWRARIREGVSPEELRDGVVRYAAFVRAKGKEGTEFVKQAATFFGPDGHWNQQFVANGNGAQKFTPTPIIEPD